jgi:hypothetical protein
MNLFDHLFRGWATGATAKLKEVVSEIKTDIELLSEISGFEKKHSVRDILKMKKTLMRQRDVFSKVLINDGYNIQLNIRALLRKAQLVNPGFNERVLSKLDYLEQELKPSESIVISLNDLLERQLDVVNGFGFFKYVKIKELRNQLLPLIEEECEQIKRLRNELEVAHAKLAEKVLGAEFGKRCQKCNMRYTEVRSERGLGPVQYCYACGSLDRIANVPPIE